MRISKSSKLFRVVVGDPETFEPTPEDVVNCFISFVALVMLSIGAIIALSLVIGNVALHGLDGEIIWGFAQFIAGFGAVSLFAMACFGIIVSAAKLCRNVKVVE